MAKRKTYEELKKELTQRQGVEKKRKKQIQRFLKQEALRKQVKEMRFRQSKVGRTVVAGKIVFKRIGAVTKGMGKSLGKMTKSLERPHQAISKSQGTIVKKPVVKKKRLSIDQVLSRLPQ